MTSSICRYQGQTGRNVCWHRRMRPQPLQIAHLSGQEVGAGFTPLPCDMRMMLLLYVLPGASRARAHPCWCSGATVVPVPHATLYLMRHWRPNTWPKPSQAHEPLMTRIPHHNAVAPKTLLATALRAETGHHDHSRAYAGRLRSTTSAPGDSCRLRKRGLGALEIASAGH